MTIRKIELFSIPVSDQDHAKRFYVDQLGFDVVHERPMGQGVRWLQVSPPGADTSVTLATWFDQPPGSVDGVVLHTDDLEGDIQVLQQRGVPIDDDVAERPWGRYVTFTDPDGNGLILQAPPQPPAT